MMEGIVADLEGNLFTITVEKEDAIVAVFLDWLNKDAQLKPVPDLQKRLLEIGPKLKKMAKNLKITVLEGKLVIRTDAESESLLSLLRRGSSWFSPHPDVNAALLLGLSNGAKAS